MLSCSMLIGLCNLLFGKDPLKDLPTAQHKAPKPVSLATLMELIWKMMQIPTFVLIIFQVCPWTLLSQMQQASACMAVLAHGLIRRRQSVHS